MSNISRIRSGSAVLNIVVFVVTRNPAGDRHANRPDGDVKNPFAANGQIVLFARPVDMDREAQVLRRP